MRITEDKIKSSVFALLLVILLLPVLQQIHPFVKEQKLNGYFDTATVATLNLNNWWGGAYQEQEVKYLNDHTGFRNDFVRVANQVDYSLFNKVHSAWTVPGKNNCLLQTIHINSYYGKDFIGYGPIKQKLCKLKAIQDTLEAMGKTMVVVHSPNKAYYYPECIPHPVSGAKKPTNLDAYMHIGDSIGIHQLNFNEWFFVMKNKSLDHLFTKQGIHWSEYGSQLAADSLERYIEKQRNIKMPYPKWIGTVRTNIARGTDDDLAKTLNLAWPMVTETFSYPQVQYVANATATKPKAVYIGDSFLLNWITAGILDHTNTDWQVWLHFSELWDHEHMEDRQQKTIAGYDWARVLEHTDYVVLSYTSFNLNDFGDGFIDIAYQHYFPGR